MKNISVKPDITIRQAMKSLIQTGEKCLVIVDGKNKLLGTLTDGDLRKAILSGVDISVSIEKNLDINIRPNSIKRCLTNVIDNGLSYGKKVEIFCNKTKKNILILIDDDGPGINENEYQNVMKPFYRIDKSRGQNKSGVGLGLSIANDIIRSHGGVISLEKSPLNGLRVKVSLPL